MTLLGTLKAAWEVTRVVACDMGVGVNSDDFFVKESVLGDLLLILLLHCYHVRCIPKGLRPY